MANKGKFIGVRRNIASAVKREIDRVLEHKQYAFAGDSTVDYSTTGAIYPVTQNLVQGDQIYNRTGDQVALHKLVVDWNAKNTDASYIATTVRTIIFVDHMNLGATPAVTDVLDTASYLSGYNNVNVQKKRFTILFDSTKDLVGQTDKSISTVRKVFLMRRKIYYNGATNTGSANSRGALFQLHISSIALATKYTYSTYYSLTYTDA